ncbi:multidrug transport protein [Lactobacillus plantarum JDM1] [Lactiplantibacillus mudanjiangensis]|uniref:MFS transporter n=1 Tax=Lactiplantibacillus mudanjiangensis TaxID=1296538 RepID=UPI001015BDAF|nr:MFS transporter [Lactiplantibacillus mudanjiangensis]VDG32486.1 multidrug transport protein [Lactobacillus plantarum JDM1] [Lactiplantibacillus mudanjiangensis]
MSTRLYTKDVKLVLAASFFYLMSPMLINPVIAGFAANIGASSILAGVVAGAMNLTSLVLRPLAGNLTDRVSKYHLTFAGGVLILLASLGYSLTTNVALILVCRVINGLGYTLCSVCMATWMASLLPADRIGSGMGIYGLANALGMAVGPAVSVYLYQHYSYQSVFWLAAAFSLLMLIVIQFVGNRSVPSANYQQTTTKKLRLVQLKVVPVALILMLFSLPYFATQTYIVSYIAHRHFAVSAGIFFPIYATILLVMRLVLRDAFDHVPFKKFIWLCLGFNLLGLIGLTDLSNWFMLLVGAFGLAAGYGLMFSICQAKALMLVPEADHGLANSTFYIGVDLGMSCGPMLAGVITTVLPWAWFYPVMMLTLPLIVIVYWSSRRLLA